jgi:hypothetical protein
MLHLSSDNFQVRFQNSARIVRSLSATSLIFTCSTLDRHATPIIALCSHHESNCHSNQACGRQFEELVLFDKQLGSDNSSSSDDAV